MANEIVQVKVRNVYGAPKIYPANAAAELFAQLAGIKTFNNHQLNLVRALGHEVQLVPDVPSLDEVQA